ncbi:MAG TPA: DUF2341 domain-containing protein, partial [Luteolibacter sp.]|nr:DUF2341 domain-containing protein [Luteolibacter sp.]
MKYAIGLMMILGMVSGARAQYADWKHEGTLAILTTPEGANLPASASVNDFPLLVRFNSDNFDFSQAKPDGSDIRFATATGVALAYQIEQWDSANQLAAVWVKIPTITGNSTQEIRMHWGKADAASESNGKAVFSAANGYASVHHMGDTLVDEIGTTTPADSGTTAANGLIGRARSFTAGKGIQCGTAITGLPTGAGPFSTGVWIRPAEFGNVVLGWGAQQAQGKVIMNLVSPPRIKMECYFGGADVTGTAAIPGAEWTHVVHTYEVGSAKLYINGVLDGNNTSGTMKIPDSTRLDIGGFVPTDRFNFVGDVDAVSISKVVRSPDWIKLEYENQKPLQTLVGSLLPTGSDFTVSPTSLNIAETKTATLKAAAGGARKVYWISRNNGKETIIATDTLTLDYTAKRLTGNESSIIQFKAVFADGAKTIDIPLTIVDAVPDPVFTLTSSKAQWNGRETITVTAKTSNLAAMQAAGHANLDFKWSVSGVAVIKEEGKNTLALKRSQGSGPMDVQLTIDNGGTPVTKTIRINVKEPAKDAWVERAPAADEKPLDKQFFARNPDTGLGTIHYNGTQDGAPDAVYLKVYQKAADGAETLHATHRQRLKGGVYRFAAPISPGLITYRVVYGTTTNKVDTDIATVSDLVCGDAYIIEGQSNALATDNSAPKDTTTTNPWVRTYGLTSGWGYAISKGNDLQLGLWGWYLANHIVSKHKMPVCIINGAVGGTRIDVHRPNPADHSKPLGTGYGESSYANLYNRVTGAKLTHGIRGLMWHQGEQSQGSGGIDPDYDYKFYQQYFVDISAAWKQDFPNLQNYYLFQIWPAACGDTSRNDQLREVQRTLPYLYSNMKIMSTLGIRPGSGCHYEPAGYQVFADLIAPLIEQDVFKIDTRSKKTAPNLKSAHFTSSARNEIALV